MRRAPSLVGVIVRPALGAYELPPCQIPSLTQSAVLEQLVRNVRQERDPVKYDQLASETRRVLEQRGGLFRSGRCCTIPSEPPNTIKPPATKGRRRL